jgi:hypothetical protein
MIIWSRWGIVVLLFIGLGIGLGFAIGGATGLIERSGPVNGVFIGIGMLLSAALLWVFNRFVVGVHIDKPKPAVMYEQLPEPVVDENNVRRTHRVIPILHPETGQQVWTNPTSTFFFVPLRFWPFVLGGLGVLLTIVNLVLTLAR